MNSNYEDFLYISWNIKQKYIILYELLLKKEPLLNNSKEIIVKNLLKYINYPVLIPHISKVFILLIKQNDNFFIYNPFLKQLNTKISIFQINIFKYLTNELAKHDIDFIWKLFLDLHKSETRYLYPIIKLAIILHRRHFENVNKWCNFKETDDVEQKIYEFIENDLSDALNDENMEIRLCAYEFLTIQTKLNVNTLKRIERFLLVNCCVDNSAFRNNLLTIYFDFLHRLETKLYGRIKIDSCHNNLTFIVNHFVFLKELILVNLKSNIYQILKTTILIYDHLLRIYYFDDRKSSRNKTNLEIEEQLKNPQKISTIERQKGLIRKYYDMNKSKKVRNYLIRINKWDFLNDTFKQLLINLIKQLNDETALNILLEHYEIINFDEYYQLFKTSTIFYETQSFAMLLSIDENLDIDELIKMSTEYFKFMLIDLKRTMIESNVLYGCLLVFTRIIQQLDDRQIDKVLELIESSVNFLLDLFKRNSETPVPSFCEMSKTMWQVLEMNEFNDEFMLKDTELILLNRIWLIFKASCEFLSVLANVNDKYHCQSLRIILRILLSNRHKGSIEAAGKALVVVSNAITLNENNSKIFDEMIGGIVLNLNEYVGSSCTRRTAGFGILIYKCCLGDKRKNKPIIELILKEFLKILKNNSTNEPRTDDGKDKVETVVLYCLKFLVHDSSLWPIIQINCQELFCQCFYHMTSNNWDTRNGAMQLYGALHQKILGQNHDVPIETINEKFPFLIPFISNELNKNNNTFELLTFFTQTFTIIYDSNNLINKLRAQFLSMTAHKNYYIRNMASDAYTQMCHLKHSPDILFELIAKCENVNCMNQLHGYMLIINKLIFKLITHAPHVFPIDIYQNVKLAIVNLQQLFVKRVPDFVLLELYKCLTKLFFLFDNTAINSYDNTANLYAIFPDIDFFDLNNNLEILINCFDLNHSTTTSSHNLNYFLDFVKTNLNIFTKNLQIFVDFLLKLYFSNNLQIINEKIEWLLISIFKIDVYLLNIDDIFVETNRVYAKYNNNKKLIDNNLAILSIFLSNAKFFDAYDVLNEKLLFESNENVVNTLLILINYYNFENDDFNFDILFLTFHLLFDENEVIRNETCKFFRKLVAKVGIKHNCGHYYTNMLILLDEVLLKVLSRSKIIEFLNRLVERGGDFNDNLNPFLRECNYVRVDEYIRIKVQILLKQFLNEPVRREEDFNFEFLFRINSE